MNRALPCYPFQAPRGTIGSALSPDEVLAWATSWAGKSSSRWGGVKQSIVAGRRISPADRLRCSASILMKRLRTLIVARRPIEPDEFPQRQMLRQSFTPPVMRQL